MDFEEDSIRKIGALFEMHSEDLSDASVSDLEERIGVLNAEIDRVKGIISEKKASHKSAEQFFKN